MTHVMVLAGYSVQGLRPHPLPYPHPYPHPLPFAACLQAAPAPFGVRLAASAFQNGIASNVQSRTPAQCILTMPLQSVDAANGVCHVHGCLQLAGRPPRPPFSPAEEGFAQCTAAVLSTLITKYRGRVDFFAPSTCGLSAVQALWQAPDGGGAPSLGGPPASVDLQALLPPYIYRDFQWHPDVGLCLCAGGGVRTGPHCGGVHGGGATGRGNGKPRSIASDRDGN